MAQAKEMDEVPASKRGPLFGMPIGVKDNIVTEGSKQHVLLKSSRFQPNLRCDSCSQNCVKRA